MLTHKRLIPARLCLVFLMMAPAVVAPAQTATHTTAHQTTAQKKAAAKKLAAQQAAKKKAAALKKAASKKPVATPARKAKPATAVRPAPPTVVKPNPVVSAPPLTPPVVTTPPAPAGPQAGQRDVAYAIGGAQITLQNAEVTDKMLPNLFGNIPPDPGTHYVLFTVNVKNDGAAPLAWTFDRFNPKLETTNASDHVLRGTSLLTASNARFETQPIQPGEEKTVRFHFQIPLGATPKTLTLSSGNTEYAFDVSDVH